MGRCKCYIGVSLHSAGDMTKKEKKDLFEWVSSGNSPLENPWCMCREDGMPYGFTAAARIADAMAAEAAGGAGDAGGAGIADMPVDGLPF